MCKLLFINKFRVFFNFLINGLCFVGLVFYRNLYSFLFGEYIKGFLLNKFCLKILRIVVMFMFYYMVFLLVICVCGEF